MNSTCHCTGWPLVVGLLAAALALPGHAAPLTFDEALRLAEDNAPSLMAQDAKYRAASSAAIAAGELPDPSLVLGVQNYPIGGPDRWDIDRDAMTMRMVGIRQEVPNRDKREARIEVANAGIDRAAAERRIARLNIRQSAALAWIGSYYAERKQAVLQDFHSENRLLADTVRARIAGGSAQPADAVAPKQEAALLEQRQDDLARQQAQNRAALRRWIGPAANDTLAGAPPEWPVDGSDYHHTLQAHPELAAFAPMAREAQARIRQAKAEKQSDWSWEVDYQHRDREFGDMVNLQLSWTLPLFPDTRQNPLIAASQAQAEQLEAEREALSREHIQQLEDELANYASLNRAVRRNHDSLIPLAEEKAALSLSSYRAGKADLASVISARRELIETRLTQIDTEEQRALSNARLHFAYGEYAQ